MEDTLETSPICSSSETPSKTDTVFTEDVPRLILTEVVNSISWELESPGPLPNHGHGSSQGHDQSKACTSPEFELTPTKRREHTPVGMEALIHAPLKLTDVDRLTPGQENTVLGKAIQCLGINSPLTPMTPRSSKNHGRSRETALTPVNRKKRSRQFSLDECMEDEPGFKKACTTPKDESDVFDLKLKFSRSQSESGVPRSIKYAMEQKENDPLLIGDCSRQYALPILTQGRHHDLKEISSATLVDLLSGKFKNVKKYTVIDCRYPYEYAGGHVRGSVNLYTEAQIHKTYFEEPRSAASNREILIFHCEFSMERGPRMCRSVRDWDRNANMSSFPSLFYPEMYVLHRGYKGFYEEQPSYCEPSNYTKMVDDSQQCRNYREKCKKELIKTKSKSVPSIKLGRSTSIKKLLM